MGTVAIVGAGYMGTALAYPAAGNGHVVRLVGTHLDDEIIRSCHERRFHPRLKRELPPGVQPYYVHGIPDALRGADVVVSGVSSYGVRWIGQAIGPHLEPGQLILSVTKGLDVAENGDLLIMPDRLVGELPERIRDQVVIAAIGGPCVAGELAGRRQSCVVYGSRDSGGAERMAAFFRTSYYHVWTTTDLVGLEVCAALKNAYALGVGMVAGISERAGGPNATGASMHNLAAACFTQAVVEMENALRIAGCEQAPARGLPGAGDLYVTCQGGRSLRLGRLLGLGHTYPEGHELLAGETLEAAECVRAMGKALPRLAARGLVDAGDFPLMRALVDVIVYGREPDLPLDAFFGRGHGWCDAG